MAKTIDIQPKNINPQRMKELIEKKGGLQNISSMDLQEEQDLPTNLDAEVMNEDLDNEIQGPTRAKEEDMVATEQAIAEGAPNIIDISEDPRIPEIAGMPGVADDVAAPEEAVEEPQVEKPKKEVSKDAEKEIPEPAPEVAQTTEFEEALQAEQNLQQKIETERLAAIDRQRGGLEQKMEQARANIKGASIFESGSMGQKILAAIAITLGGLGGGENQALKVLQNQENKIINMNRDLLNQYQKQLGSLDEAKIAVKNDYYEAVLNKIQQMKELAHPLMKLKMDKIENDMLRSKAELENKLVERAQKMVEKQKETLVRDQFGNPLGHADTKEAAKEVRDLQRSAFPSIEAIDELIREVESGKAFSPSRRAKINSQLLLLTGKLREAVLGPGTMQQAEFERLLSTLGDPNKVFALSSSQKAKLNAVKKSLQNEVKNAYRVTGVSSRKESKTFRRK